MATPTTSSHGIIGVSGDYFCYYDDVAGERRVILGANSGTSGPSAGHIRVNGSDFQYVPEGGGNWRTVGGGTLSGGGTSGRIGVRGDSFLWDNGTSFYGNQGDLDFLSGSLGLTLTDRDCDVLVDISTTNNNPTYLQDTIETFRDSNADNDETFDLVNTGNFDWADTNVTDGVTYTYYAKYSLTDSEGTVLTTTTAQKSVTWTDNCGGGGGTGSPSIDSFTTSSVSGSTVSVSANYSDLDGTQTAEIDWGDFNTDSYSSPPTTASHTYSVAGEWTITLTLYDSNGTQIDSATTTANTN